MAKKQQGIIKIVVFVFMIANFIIWYTVDFRDKDDVLRVVFLDVGQGDAIFIETPNGNQILLDGGPNNKVLRALSKEMPFYDRTIDMIIVSHPDQDHIGGLPAVLSRFEVDVFVDSGVKNNTSVRNALDEAVIKEKSRHIIAQRGMRLHLDEDVFLDILFPDRDVSNLGVNDASIIAKLVYGETSFLLTGDTSQKMEKFLVSTDTESLKSDVLKLGHHGSKTSSSEIFVGFISPKYVVVSAGEDNKYGHPHQEVLNIAEKFEATVLKTFELGNITFLSDGINIKVAK